MHARIDEKLLILFGMVQNYMAVTTSDI